MIRAITAEKPKNILDTVFLRNRDGLWISVWRTGWISTRTEWTKSAAAAGVAP